MEKQCGICCDSFLIPRLLKCCHYFCQCCIEGVQVDDKVTCVTCGEVTVLTSVKQLPYHPLYFHNANSTTKERVCCVCLKKASLFCLGCDDDYCDECCSFHQKMKVARNHVVQPSANNSRLLTCETHSTQKLEDFCVNCERLLCKMCVECDKNGHQIMTASQACDVTRKKIDNEFLANIGNMLDNLDKTKNGFLTLKQERKEAANNVKHQIAQQISYLISLLESKEKQLYMNIDTANDANNTVIDAKITEAKRAIEELSVFENVLTEWRGITMDSALLHSQVFLTERYKVVMSRNTITSPCLDSLSVSFDTDLLSLIIQKFGALTVQKRSTSIGSFQQKWNVSHVNPPSITKSENCSNVYQVESLWDSQKQKVRVKEVQDDGISIRNVWACSKVCKKSADAKQPVIASNGKDSIAVGIGHEIILVDLTNTKKSYKFGKQGSYPGQTNTISSISFSSGGSVLVADSVLNRVSMYSPEGEFILCFGTASPKNGLVNNHALNRPSAITVDSRDYVYVADTSHNRVVVFNHQGCFVKVIGSEGTSSGQFHKPCDLVIRQNVLAVLETGNKRVQFISTDYENTVYGVVPVPEVKEPRYLIWLKPGKGDGVISGDVIVVGDNGVFKYSLSR